MHGSHRYAFVLALFIVAWASAPAADAGQPDGLPAATARAPRFNTDEEMIAHVLRIYPQARRHADGTVFLTPHAPPQMLSVRVMNLSAADTTNADQLWSGGGLSLNLTGLGVTVGLWDGGLARNTHQELAGRVTLVEAGSFADHPTHVAGTIGAVGVSPAARGMASQVLIRSRDLTSDTAEMSSDAGLISLSNHSYGNLRGWTNRIDWGIGPVDSWMANRSSFTEDPAFGKYEGAANVVDEALFGPGGQIANAKNLDTLLFDNPHLLAVWSAGNDRGESFTNAAGTNRYVTYRSSGSSGPGFYLVRASQVPAPAADGGASGFDVLPQSQVAKNTLTVGAINDITADPYTAGHVSLASFSAFGPCDDGRVKPDVVGNGVGLTSSISTSDTAYGVFSGTSMSSPNVCGTLALLIQHFRNLSGGASPRSATLKALAIHTAFDAGNAGPDYSFGWGVMDAAAATLFLNDARSAAPQHSHLVENTYSGGVQDFEFCSSGDGPIRATLVWTDPPPTALPGSGLDDAARVLVNDLDLKILGPPGSTTYHPWTLNPASPSTPAVRTGRNQVDNVEQVLIDAPAAGTYTVRVSHTGGLFTQDYSLLVTADTCQPPRSITHWRTVRMHAALGPVPIELDPAATGNDLTGPTVESRTGGIQRIEIAFDGPVTLVQPAAVSVSGQTTNQGALEPPLAYVPTSVTLAAPDTIALEFTAGALPDQTCYTVSVGPGAIAEDLAGDSDCLIRALVGDATRSGRITLSDAIAAVARIGEPATSNPGFDIDLTADITPADALAAKSQLGRQALCP